MRRLICLAVVLALSFTAFGAEPGPVLKGPSGISWTEGKHFTRVSAPAAPASKGAVEVVEFFRYDCNVCYALEPFMVIWKRSSPSDVQLVQVPVIFQPRQRPLAQMHYALEAMGLAGTDRQTDLRHRIFDAVQRVGVRLTDPDDRRAFDLQLKFVTSLGVNGEAFTRAYRSPEVIAKTDRAAKLMIQYQIDSTPSIVINGVYKTNAGFAGGEWFLVELLKDLTASEKTRVAAR